MKKNFFKATVAVFLFLSVGVTVWKSQHSKHVDDLVLANVEALADTEITDGQWVVTIYSTDHWKCDNGGAVCCPGYDC